MGGPRKIFFTLGGTDYACSGALVRSGRGYLVLTAAHCVTNGARPVGGRLGVRARLLRRRGTIRVT